MSKKMTEKEIRTRMKYSPVLALGYCAASYLLSWDDKEGYTSGVYGWNFDVFNVNGLTICTGYRRMIGTYSNELVDVTRKYNELARKHRERMMWATNEPRHNRLVDYIRRRWVREILAHM